MVRKGLDAERLAAAYERDGRRLLVYFTRRTYDAQLAVDLVAETYARAFELHLVFGIARDVLHEALRRGQAERRALGGSAFRRRSSTSTSRRGSRTSPRSVSCARSCRERSPSAGQSSARPCGCGSSTSRVRAASVTMCAGPDHAMLGVSGIVPNGVPAVFLTAPDGSAVKADVKDNG